MSIYYHLEKNECDFVIKKGLNIISVIQVCNTAADHLIRKREFDGLKSALIKYNIDEGLILTLEEEEIIRLKDKRIVIKPIWKWLLE